MTHDTRCPFCHATVIAGTVAGGTQVLFDPEPSRCGRWVLDRATGAAHRVPAAAIETGLVPHRATCDAWGALPAPRRTAPAGTAPTWHAGPRGAGLRRALTGV